MTRKFINLKTEILSRVLTDHSRKIASIGPDEEVRVNKIAGNSKTILVDSDVVEAEVEVEVGKE